MRKLHESYSNVKKAKVSFLLIFILVIALSISACGKSSATDATSDSEPEIEEVQEPEQEQVQEADQEESPTEEQIEEILSIDEIVTSFEPESSVDIPDYSGEACVVMNNNIPFFTKENLPTKSFEYYSELDELGRCGVACANVGQDIMPTEDRGSIGQIKPSGWQTVKYDNIDGKYLYNRCHLIARQFYIKKVNKRGLITGTRNFNVDGMFEYEDKVANYIKENPEHHILYRVKPYFRNSNLLACGVQMEILDLDDEGKLSYNVFIYNKQHGFTIDYRNGDVYSDNPLSLSGKRLGYNIYVIDKDTGKFHKESCASVCDIKNKKYFAGKEQTIEEKYCKCDICIS